jgi:hypothetical protein
VGANGKSTFLETIRALLGDYSAMTDFTTFLKRDSEGARNDLARLVGKVRARGKAWPVGESEPAEWTIEHVDPVGNRQGSPGIFADAQNEVLFDNLKVTKN